RILSCLRCAGQPQREGQCRCGYARMVLIMERWKKMCEDDLHGARWSRGEIVPSRTGVSMLILQGRVFEKNLLIIGPIVLCQFGEVLRFKALTWLADRYVFRLLLHKLRRGSPMRIREPDKEVRGLLCGQTSLVFVLLTRLDDQTAIFLQQSGRVSIGVSG